MNDLPIGPFLPRDWEDNKDPGAEQARRVIKEERIVPDPPPVEDEEPVIE